MKTMMFEGIEIRHATPEEAEGMSPDAMCASCRLAGDGCARISTQQEYDLYGTTCVMSDTFWVEVPSE